MHGVRRDVHEVAGLGVDVPLVTLELQPQHAGDDVEAGVVDVVVVPARDRARLGDDLACPELVDLERLGPRHAGRGVGRLEVSGLEYDDGSGHVISLPPQ